MSENSNVLLVFNGLRAETRYAPTNTKEVAIAIEAAHKGFTISTCTCTARRCAAARSRSRTLLLVLVVVVVPVDVDVPVPCAWLRSVCTCASPCFVILE